MSTSIPTRQEDGRPTVLKAAAEATAKRVAMLLDRNPSLVDCLPQTQAVKAVQERCKHTISVVESLCALYEQRPAVAWRPASQPSDGILSPFATMTYGQLWQRVGRLATGLAQHNLAGPGRYVGVWGHASPSWLVADLACLYLAASAAPLQTSLPLSDLSAWWKRMRCKPSSVVRSNCPRWPSWLGRRAAFIPWW